MFSPLRQLLTATQVAQSLNVKEATVRKWAHEEFIPRVKLGRALRFDLQDIGLGSNAEGTKRHQDD